VTRRTSHAKSLQHHYPDVRLTPLLQIDKRVTHRVLYRTAMRHVFAFAVTQAKLGVKITFNDGACCTGVNCPKGVPNC
jgi:hypothetical protein